MRWRTIKELNGLYKVSDKGLVKKTKTNKLMTPKPNYKGYLRITFIIKGKRTILRVHRLVAQAFVPNPKNLPQVNHKNGIKTDNRADNLEWVTNEQNYEHALKNNLVWWKKRPIALFENEKEIARYSSIGQASRERNIPYNKIYYELTKSKHKQNRTRTELVWKYV